MHVEDMEAILEEVRFADETWNKDGAMFFGSCKDGAIIRECIMDQGWRRFGDKNIGDWGLSLVSCCF